MSLRLLCDGKIAVITGAAALNGLGFATARMLAAHGACIAILDLKNAKPEAAAAELGEKHIGLAADVTNKATCDAAIEQVLNRFGRIDILVNNAGIVQTRTTLGITPEDYDAVLNVNLRGALIMSQAVLPTMREQKGGAIVCISSIAARRGGGIVGGAHYAASKAGVLGLARAMAREFGADGIRVNSICPSVIATNMGALVPREYEKAIVDQIPLGRIGEPDDIAGCVLFLASDLSRYCTGVTLDVNGGMYIN